MVVFSYQEITRIEVVLALALVGLVLFAILTSENRDGHGRP